MSGLTKVEARAVGLKTYTKCKPCFWCGQQERSVATGVCMSCQRDHGKARWDAADEYMRERSRRNTRRWQKENPGRYKAQTAKYRADRIRATPKWADQKKIQEIYENCPPGYHVDHVVPLCGKNVCGLHVENNLQYLPASENLSKSNKFAA